ncbi:MAG: ARMT1-like domain-containing protein [Sulfolobales archaeon]
MWVSSYCKLCLVQSRCLDLLKLSGEGLIPQLLKYLGDIVELPHSSEAFAKSFTYVKSLLRSEDPYKDVKDLLSVSAAVIAGKVRKYLDSVGWDLARVLEFSAAANVVDTSVLGFEPKELEDVIWDKPAINEFRKLSDSRVVIALDNAGEFEVDLILAEALVRNGFEVVLAVRSESYEVDMTYDGVVRRVLPNGVRVVATPGNMPPAAYVRDGFLISKGIANAEAYVELNHHVKSLHLLRVKCEVLSKLFSVPKGSSLILDGDTLLRTLGKS